MTGEKEKSFIIDLDQAHEKCWQILIEGKKDRNSPVHTPVVGTITGENHPSQRVMVLREVDRENRMLRFNTDVRVSKVADIGDGAPVSVLCYHPEYKIQLRLFGTGRIDANSPMADEAWGRASLYGKRCYLADPAPGTQARKPTSGLDPDIEGRKPKEAEIAPARANFAILLFEIERIDWLYLAHTGHRRAEFLWNGHENQWDSQWLVP